MNDTIAIYELFVYNETIQNDRLPVVEAMDNRGSCPSDRQKINVEFWK